MSEKARPPLAALAGLPAVYYGRNRNNTLTFQYGFVNSDESSTANLSGLRVVHSNGQQLSISFTQQASGPVISSLTAPDNTQTTYSYNPNGALLEVDHPGNNASSYIGEYYDTFANGLIADAISPQYVIDYRANGTRDGYAVELSYGSTAINGNAHPLTEYDEYSDVNPIFGSGSYNDDGQTNGAFQAGYASGFPTSSATKTNTFQYNVGPSSNLTQVADSDGHSYGYYHDSNFRVIQTSLSTGSTILNSLQSWNAKNEPIALVDVRGYETDLAYDSQGNLIAKASPQVTAAYGSNLVSVRPTTYFAYDTNHNLKAICDPVWSHKYNHDWNTTPTETPCFAGSGVRSFFYSTSSSTPTGEVSTETSALGYVIHYSYDPTKEGSGIDLGLPTKIAGDTYTQAIDNSSGGKTQTSVYDALGRVSSSSTDGTNFSRYSYDANNRPLTVTDPDGVVTSTSYYPNGQLLRTQNATEAIANVASMFTYDVNGNRLTEQHNLGNNLGMMLARFRRVEVV